MIEDRESGYTDGMDEKPFRSGLLVLLALVPVAAVVTAFPLMVIAAWLIFVAVQRLRATRFQFGLGSLFVVVLLAALVARAVPEVQAAREAARRTPCTNNLRIGVPMQRPARLLAPVPATPLKDGESFKTP